MSRARGSDPRGRPGARQPWRVAALVAILALSHTLACVRREPEVPPDTVPAAESAVLDPVGVYDLTMSSETMVSEGTMEIYGEPGEYRGRFSVGVVAAPIVLVEPGEGQLNVQVDVDTGRLTLRLVGDGSFLSGNWVLGQRRGTVVAERHELVAGRNGRRDQD